MSQDYIGCSCGNTLGIILPWMRKNFLLGNEGKLVVDIVGVNH